MSTRIKLRIFIISLIILIFSILLFTGTYFKKQKNAGNFDYILNKIDKSENNLKIDDLYNLALKFAHSSIQYKSLLKRLYMKSDLDNLIRISSTAYNHFPNDNQILSIYLYSLLKNNNIEDALKLISNLKDKNVEENFIFETNILSGNVSSGESIYYKVLQSNQSTLFKKLYQKTQDINFLIDSGLLYLENGDYKSAASIFSNKKIEQTKLLFYVNYYTKQYQKAGNLLLTQDLGLKVEDLKLFQIDIFIKQKLYVKANEEIIRFINLFPYYSPIPYINSIMISLINGDNSINFDLKDIISKFPDNRSLLLAIVDFNLKNNKKDSSLTFIKNYLRRNSSDAEIDIILKQITGISKPDNLVNLLYELVNQYPENETGSRFLAFNLYANREMVKLDNYLKRFNTENTIGWVIFYQALLDCYNGKNNKAIDEFESSYTLDNHWQTLYNLSILSQQTNNYSNAIEYLQQAENSLFDSKQNIEVKSKIRTKLASLFFEIKDYNKCYRELKHALDMDQNNIKAILLFNKLESAAY